MKDTRTAFYEERWTSISLMVCVILSLMMLILGLGCYGAKPDAFVYGMIGCCLYMIFWLLWVWYRGIYPYITVDLVQIKYRKRYPLLIMSELEERVPWSKIKSICFTFRRQAWRKHDIPSLRLDLIDGQIKWIDLSPARISLTTRRALFDAINQYKKIETCKLKQ